MANSYLVSDKNNIVIDFPNAIGCYVNNQDIKFNVVDELHKKQLEALTPLGFIWKSYETQPTK